MTLSELNTLRLKMIESKNNFDSSFNEYASCNCGHKFGDVVEINGFSHRGKLMKIDAISTKYDNWKGDYFAVLGGYVLKNDGMESKNRATTNIYLGTIK